MYEIYTTTNGDTLLTIANKFGTTEEELININGFMDNYNPVPQSQIIVPSNQKETYKYYTVKNGDNIYDIAKKHNIDHNLLLKMNGLDKEDYIYPNQTIILPKSNLNFYLTKLNDTITKILEKLDISIEELLEENKDIYLEPDQIIIIKEK